MVLDNIQTMPDACSYVSGRQVKEHTSNPSSVGDIDSGTSQELALLDKILSGIFFFRKSSAKVRTDLHII